MAEPARKGGKLTQLLVGMIEDPVGEEVQTVECFNNGIEFRGIQTENIGQLVEFG